MKIYSKIKERKKERKKEINKERKKERKLQKKTSKENFKRKNHKHKRTLLERLINNQPDDKICRTSIRPSTKSITFTNYSSISVMTMDHFHTETATSKLSSSKLSNVNVLKK